VDELALRVLAGLDGILRPGGWALLRFDAPGTQQEVVERVRKAVTAELDVGVFGFTTVGPDLVALGYAGLADPTLGSRYRDQVSRYHRHMVDAGLDHFTGTMTAVHRPLEGGRAPAVTLSAAGQAVPRWPYIVARLTAVRLAAAADSNLLTARPSPPPGSRLAAELGLDEAGLGPAFVVRHPAGSVAEDLELNEAGAALLQLFAGGRRTAAVVNAYATATAKDPEEAATDVIEFARDALRRGLLLPTSL